MDGNDLCLCSWFLCPYIPQTLMECFSVYLYMYKYKKTITKIEKEVGMTYQKA